jgi:hypothetical protein
MKKSFLLLNFIFANYILISQNVKISTSIPTGILRGMPIKIETSITKKEITGIARMQYELPKGLKAIEGNSNNGLFSFSNHVIQLLWIQLPVDTVLTFDFSILPDTNYSGIAEIEGRFSYINDSKKEEVNMIPFQLSISGHGEKSFEKYKASIVKANPVKPTSAKQSQKAPSKPTTNKPNPSIKTDFKKPVEQNKPAPIVKKTSNLKNDNSVKNKTSAPTQEKIVNVSTATKKENITFRIQLAASVSMLDKEELSAQFKYKVDDINEEQLNNVYKYTTGQFVSFKEAKKAFSLNESLKGKAFIVGYKDGKRIDLEEAIQLSK